jgi:hypothetical protein
MYKLLLYKNNFLFIHTLAFQSSKGIYTLAELTRAICVDWTYCSSTLTLKLNLQAVSIIFRFTCSTCWALKIYALN